MLELGGWGFVVVMALGALLVWRIAVSARRKLRRKARALLMVAVATSYLGVGAGTLDLGGFLGGDRCEAVSQSSVSLADAPAHVLCGGADRVSEAVTPLKDLFLKKN